MGRFCFEESGCSPVVGRPVGKGAGIYGVGFNVSRLPLSHEESHLHYMGFRALKIFGILGLSKLTQE